MNDGTALPVQAQFVIDKIKAKLIKPVENLARAKLIVRYIRELKALISENEAELEAINSLLLENNVGGYLMVSYSKLLKYALLVDETLRCLLPIIRQKSAMKRDLILQLVEHGAAVFALHALRDFEKQESIRVQALELLACVVEQVGSRSSLDDATTSSSSEERKTITTQELVHQLVLNGCTSTFPILLTFYSESHNEISSRRTIACLMFLMKNSPKELSMTLITVNNWAMIRACAQVLKNFTTTTQVEAIELVIGLLVCSPVSGEKLLQFGGVDDAVRVIVENTSSIKVHFLWTKKAIANVASLASMAVGYKKEIFVKLIGALQSLARLGVMKVNVEGPTTTTAADNVHSTGTNEGEEPLASEEQQSYWHNSDIIKSKKTVTLVERLKTCPLHQNIGGGDHHTKEGELPKILKVKAEKDQAFVKDVKTVSFPSALKKPKDNLVIKESQPLVVPTASQEEVLKTLGAVQKVAERLFDSSVGVPTTNDTTTSSKVSTIDQLTYAERLQVMIMQVQEGMAEESI